MTTQRTYNQAMIDARMHIEHGTVPMLWGAGGIGKSAMGAEIASDMGIGFIDTRPSLREAVDFRGLPVPDLVTGKTRWLIPNDFPQVERDGPRGIWMLDEISACQLSVQVALYSLIWDGHLGEYRKPDGWIIMGAGNRVQDRA